MPTENNEDLSKLSNEDAKDLLKKLCDKLDNLETRESEVSKKHEGTEVEKDSLLRQIRYDKRSIGSEINELQFAQMRKDHTPASSDGGLMSKLNSKIFLQISEPTINSCARSRYFQLIGTEIL